MRATAASLEWRETAGERGSLDEQAGEPDGARDDWTADERRAFRASLDARRRRQLQAGRLFGLALLALVAAGVVLRLPESWWVPGAGALAARGLVFRLANWKCPHCGERLPTRGSLARCLGCGAPLDSGSEEVR